MTHIREIIVIILVIREAFPTTSLHMLFNSVEGHPWAGEDLSLKIDERDQTIWICILEQRPR